MWWLRNLPSRSKVYDDLAEEIRQHLDERIEVLMSGGRSREEAEHAARVRQCSVDRRCELCVAAAARTEPLDEFRRDHGARVRGDRGCKRCEMYGDAHRLLRLRCMPSAWIRTAFRHRFL
jgi:hypothetical protein